jgi:hypothetical protein
MSIIKEDELSIAYCMNGETWNTYVILRGEHEGKRPLGRPRCRFVDPGEKGLRFFVDWSGSRKSQGYSTRECDKEPLGSVMHWKTIEWLHNWWPFEQC